MGTHLLGSLGSKGKNGNSLACLRNAGSHSAESYCIENTAMRRKRGEVYMFEVTVTSERGRAARGHPSLSRG